MERDPHRLAANWPMIYADGEVIAGQSEGAGWNVTHNVVGFRDVYHQGEVAHVVLVEAVHREIERPATTGSEMERVEQTAYGSREHPQLHFY